MTSSYDPQYNVFRNDVTGAVTTMRPTYREKRPTLSEYSRQQGEDSAKYWVGKNLDDKQSYLIFQNGSYYVFGSSPDLPNGGYIHSFIYYEALCDDPADKKERKINEKLEEISEYHKKNYAVSFSTGSLKFRLRMETDAEFAQNPKRQQIKDLMDRIVANNEKNLKKACSFSFIYTFCAIL